MTKAQLQAYLERMGAKRLKFCDDGSEDILYVAFNGFHGYVTHKSQDELTEDDRLWSDEKKIHTIQSYEDAKGFINSISERG